MAYIDMELDVSNLNSPQPMLHTLRAMDKLMDGQILRVTTTEPASVKNFEQMCQQTGHTLMAIQEWDDEITFLLRKD